MKKSTLLVACLMLLGNFTISAQSWSVGGNNLTTSSRFGSNNNYSVLFETNNTERGRLTNTGLWGLGTSSPNAKVHINSAAGLSPFRVQLNGSTKLLVNGEGGVSIGTGSFAPVNGLMVSGTVGIGTTDVSEYKLKVRQNGSYGLNLENPFTEDDWELWTGEDGALYLWANDSPRGSFDAFDGSYSSISDERSKTNIKPMASMLGKINQLKPTTYQFKANPAVMQNGAATATTNTEDHKIGFLAQDVMKVFPSLVTHHVNKERNLDNYTLDYSGFGVIAIKGIQELQQTVQEQQKTINTLIEKLTKLEAAGSSTGSNIKLNPADLLGVSLEQNQPNPVGDNTTFRYTIPANAHAQILVYNSATGKLVKTLQAPATGQVEMNASDLEIGTYIYTLVVNGKQAAAKQLILSK